MNERVMITTMAERLLSDEEAANFLATEADPAGRQTTRLSGVDITRVFLKGDPCILVSPAFGLHCLLYPVVSQANI